jgi:hypothetical protein
MQTRANATRGTAMAGIVTDATAMRATETAGVISADIFASDALRAAAS